MDGLADKCSATLSGPAPLDWARVVLVGTKPFDVRVSLQDLSQSACIDCLLEKKDRVVEAMLADHAQLNASFLCQNDHPLRGLKINGHRLLYKHVLPAFRTKFYGGKTISRKRADVDEIDLRMTAKLFDSFKQFRTSGIGKLATTFWRSVCAGSQLVANILVGISMLPCDCARSNNSNSHLFPRRTCLLPG